MRKRVLTSVGVLVFAALTVQTAVAVPRSAGKVARAPAHLNHRFRQSFGYEPKAVGSKSCDIIWCYEN